MELEQIFQGVRLLVHIVTFLVVAGYCPDPDSSRRWGVSAFAVVLAGGSSCLAVSTLLSWSAWQCMPMAGQVFLTLIFAGLLVPLLAGRGNVATLFPRKPWSHRP